MLVDGELIKDFFRSFPYVDESEREREKYVKIDDVKDDDK